MTIVHKEYEIFYFLPITFTPEEVSSVREKISAIIEKFGGTITKEEDLGKKKLTFTIKGARHGYYFLLHFTCPPQGAAKVDQEIKLMPEIIRHRLVIKKDYKMPHVSNAYQATEKSEATPPLPPSVETKKEVETGKVDMQELDRKIDELLLDNI